MGVADKTSAPYKSHYGSNQYWHAMSPGSHLTNQQIVDLILKQHEIWWQWALLDPIGTRGIPIPLGILPQGLFHVGKILHTVQDVFSHSHTIRNAKGEVTTFQDYTAQDGTAHAEADKDRATKALHDIPGATAAIKHSAEVLKLFKKRRPFAELRTYLLTHVLNLAPGAGANASGGSQEKYRASED